MKGGIEFSLEDVAYLLKNPPLIVDIFCNLGRMTKERKERAFLIKGDYTHALERVVLSEKKKLPITFRSFLKKYSDYFGEEGYGVLDMLNNECIEYVVGSLKFDSKMKANKKFIPWCISTIEQ